MTTKLSFNGLSVTLQTLMKSAKAFPVIELSKAEAADTILAPLSGEIESNDNPVIVFKHEGKYVIFSGQKKVRDFVKSKETSMSARLVSKHAFKHLKTVTVPLQEQNRVATVVERKIEDSQRQPYYEDRPAYQPRQDRAEGFNTPRLFQPRTTQTRRP